VGGSMIKTEQVASIMIKANSLFPVVIFGCLALSVSVVLSFGNNMAIENKIFIK